MFDITFDGPDWDRLTEQVVEAAVQMTEGSVQAQLDQLGEQLKGQPVEVIKPPLRQIMIAHGATTVDDDWLDLYATAISEGRPIEARITEVVD